MTVGNDWDEWSHYWCEDRDRYVLLRVRQDSLDEDPLEHCLIYEPQTGGVTLIENDTFARNLKRKMYEAGVPIRTREELPPPPTSEPMRVLDEMLSAGASKAEIRKRMNELREQEEREYRERRRRP